MYDNKKLKKDYFCKIENNTKQIVMQVFKLINGIFDYSLASQSIFGAFVWFGVSV